MANETEPRALSAALSAPAFVTRGNTAAMHAATRHVERWAPEQTAGRVRSMRSLGFVDRLVAPWMETAQRSASMRLFNQYASSGPDAREPSAVSWVFPRPWYQDELDWMAAARQTTAETQAAQRRQVAPTLLTTRGTYVAPAQVQAASGPTVVMPSALYEYVAPSLSIAASGAAQRQAQGVGFGGETLSSREVYSPLVSLAAVQAAELMSRTVAPLAMQRRGVGATTAMTPGLRSVLSSILERAAAARVEEPSRLSMSAPEMVTPPSPRPSDLPGAMLGEQGAAALLSPASSAAASAAAMASTQALQAQAASAASAARVAQQYAEQRARILELQRIAQHSAQREMTERAEATARTQATEAAASTAAASRQASDARSAAIAAATTAQQHAQRTAAQQAAAQRAAAQNATAEQVAQATQAAQSAEVRTATERAEAELRQRAGQTRSEDVQRQAEAAAARATEAQRQAETAAGAARVEAQRQADVARAEAQRLAEVAASSTTARAAAAQRQAETASAAERARIEERISQGVAQQASARSAAQRLHEQARAEAAVHARASIEAQSRASATGGRTASSAAYQPPAEVAAAIASLPPELAAILGGAVNQRPERTVQAIGELNETLRAAELLARSTASGNGFEVTRGPRVMMPAGLGGLVNAVDRAQAIGARSMLGGPRQLAPLAQFVAPPSSIAATASAQAAAAAGAPAMTFTQTSMRAGRVPSLPWLAGPTAAPSIAPTTALGATTSAAPAALTHVAWADRWLARFAGANPQSLNLMTASAGSAPEVRMAALANVAPGAVFVAPDFLRSARGDELVADSATRSARSVAIQQAQADATARATALAQAGIAMSPSELARIAGPEARSAASSASSSVASAPAASSVASASSASSAATVPARPDMQLINAPVEPARRFDDNEETPDDVFAAISAAASRSRSTRPSASAPGVQPAAVQARAADIAAAQQAAAQQAAALAAFDRQTYADVVAHAAPSAPGAGLSAQLASSPFAPALRHVLPLPSAASFDVRSLFGAGLGATYLAGLVGAAPRELEVGAQMPTWASWDLAPLAQIGQLGQLRAAGGFVDSDDRIDRLVPDFDAAYVTAADPLAATGAAGADALSPEVRAALEAQLAAGASPESLGAANLAALRAAQVAQAQAQAQAAAAAQGSSSAAGFDPATAGVAPSATGYAPSATGYAPSAEASSQAAAAAAAAAAMPAATITTLRSALLSWGLTISDEAIIGQAASGAPSAVAGQPVYQQFAPTTFVTPPARGGLQSTGAARTMLDVMALPMLGDVDAAPSPAWSAPGMIAERAHSFSVAQERSASDLALDFVTPELVLAARVYGLGPAEAAQAARLAIVGPGQLGAMASAVDRTFVDAMAIVRDNRNSDDRRQRTALSTALSGDGLFAGAERSFVSPSATAPGVPGVTVPGATAPGAGMAPTATTSAAVAAAIAAGATTPDQLISTLTAQGASAADVRAAIATAFPTADGSIAAAIAPTTRAPAALSEALGSQTHPSFGVERRAPRGAFLWPQATVAALGMHAAGSDGQLSMSVAALELLAAQVVAEVGTYAALSEADTGARISAGEASDGEVATAATAAVASSNASAASSMSTSTSATASAASSPMQAAIAAAIAAGVEPSVAAARAAQLIAGAPLVASRAGAPSLLAQPGGAEPAEADVLSSAAQLVPAARRARFDALYVALSQTPAGRSWSPAARAARALALAGRSDDTAVTARERAATAWDVLPVVYPSEAAAAIAPSATAGEGDLETAASAAAAAMSSYVAPSSYGSHGGAAGSVDATGAGSWSPQGAVQRASRRHGATRGSGVAGGYVAPDGFSGETPFVAPSPGLSGLSARAGNALGAYVAPVAAPSAPASSSSHVNSVGAAMRAPSAQPEYVQTGRSSGRFGGGEVEIPQWFEAAARKMFADKSGDGGDGISMAELTLVNSAPQNQIAASSRSSPASAPPAPGGGAQVGQQSPLQIDVEKLAHDIYREILVMMDTARARNGDPYQ